MMINNIMKLVINYINF